MSGAGYTYLNREGRWPGFTWRGLELDRDGALRLLALPRLVGRTPADIASMTPPDGPGGLALAGDGTLYWSDTDGHRIWSLDGCDAAARPLACFGGEGAEPTQLRRPRGLVLHPTRGVLIVADSGNHRLQVFDPALGQLVDVWGGPGQDAGELDAPGSLAADPAGHVYAVDFGNRRVQKFDLGGTVVASFWEQARATGPSFWPSEVSVEADGVGTRICIRSIDGARVHVFDATGDFLETVQLASSHEGYGFLVESERIFVGDAERLRLFAHARTGALVGEAQGYEGPVAALAGDPQAGLWLHPGGAQPPLRLDFAGAAVRRGSLWGGPVDLGLDSEAWHRVRALGELLPSGAHFSFLTIEGEDPALDPGPPPAAALGSATSSWTRRAADVIELLVGGPAAPRYVWIAAQLESDGTAQPRLDQLRVDFDHEQYSAKLPPIYLQKPGAEPSPDVLERLLSLFKSTFDDVEEEIDALPRLFDAEAVPAEHLEWLSGWLALDYDERWTEERGRRALAAAFESYGWRGTARGLRASLALHAGVDAQIEEPHASTAWWALASADDPQPIQAASRLGFGTRIAPAEAHGAVLGTNAVLDGSNLLYAEDAGSPIFEDTAHRFTVYVYPAQLRGPEHLEEVRRVIEREKPAHTDYRLCVVEPAMSVGYQARTGIDTIVGGDPGPTAVASGGTRLGEQATLGGIAAGHVGMDHLGSSTFLGEGLRPASDCAGHKPEKKETA